MPYKGMIKSKRNPTMLHVFGRSSNNQGGQFRLETALSLFYIKSCEFFTDVHNHFLIQEQRDYQNLSHIYINS